MEWLRSPAAEPLLAWQKDEAEAVVGNVFGYHGLEIGVGVRGLNLLTASKVLHQIRVDVSSTCIRGAVHAPPELLPWCDDVFNLIVVHHVLDSQPNPGLMEEIVRSLAPEGVLCVFGLNRFSLTSLELGVRRGLGQIRPAGISARALGASLNSSGVDILMTRFGCHQALSDMASVSALTRPIGRGLATVAPRSGSGFVLIARKRSLIRPLRLRDRFRRRVSGPAWADPARFGSSGLTKAGNKKEIATRVGANQSGH